MAAAPPAPAPASAPVKKSIASDRLTYASAIQSDYIAWYKQCQFDLKVKHETIVAKLMAEADIKLLDKDERGDYIVRGLVQHYTKDQVKIKTKVVDGVVQLAKFKYTEAADLSMRWQRAARGTMVQDGQWLFAPNKFVNDVEMQDDVDMSPTEFLQCLIKQGFAIFATPKIDGTCAQVFADAKGVLHAYTLGSVDTEIKMQQAIDISPTFSKAILELVPKHHVDVLRAHPYHQVYYELVTGWNPIVTKYRGIVSCALARTPEDVKGGFLSPLMDIAPDGIPRRSLLPSDEYVHFDDVMAKIDVANLKSEIGRVFKILVDDPETYGENTEGIVLTARRGDVSVPVIKCKRPEYNVLHHSTDMILNVGDHRDLCKQQFLVVEHKADDVAHPTRRQHAKEFTQYLLTQASRVAKEAKVLNACKDRATFARLVSKMHQDGALPLWISGRILFETCQGGKDAKTWLPEDESEAFEWCCKVLQRQHSQTKESKTILEHCQDGHKPFWFLAQEQQPVQHKTKREEKRLQSVASDSKSEARGGAVAPAAPPPATPALAPLSTKVIKILDTTKMLLVDYDNTLVEYQSGLSPEYYLDEAALRENKASPHIMSFIRAHGEAGYRVSILTGRKVRLEPALKENLKRWNLTVDKVYCCPEDVATLKWKQTVLRSFKDVEDKRFEIIHLDDDERVLNEGRRVFRQCQHSRYMPFHVDRGQVRLFLERPAFVVALVQPPASGKSTVLAALDKELNMKTRMVSYDALKHQYPHASPQVLYQAFDEALREAIYSGDLTIVDGCHDDFGSLKRIDKMRNVSLLTATFMPQVACPKDKDKDKSKKKAAKAKAETKLESKETSIFDAYLDLCIERARLRVATGDMNGSTLEVSDPEDLAQVVRAKAIRCLEQVERHHVTRLQGATVEEMTRRLGDFVREQMSQAATRCNCFLGLAVPPHLWEDMKRTIPCESEPVANPHVTIAYTSTDIEACLPHVGQEVLVDVLSTYGNDQVQVASVRLAPLLEKAIPLPRYPHITISLAKSKLNGKSLKPELGHELVKTKKEAELLSPQYRFTARIIVMPSV